jgi:hypothetical protein
MICVVKCSLITPAGRQQVNSTAAQKVFGAQSADPAARMRIQGPRWPLDEPFAEAGAISRYPRLPFGVIHAMRGAKRPAARLRVCEWRTRAGVVVVVDMSHLPTVAERQPVLRMQSITPGRLSARARPPSCVALGLPCYAQRSPTRCRFSHRALISTHTSNPQLPHRAAEDAVSPDALVLSI